MCSWLYYLFFTFICHVDVLLYWIVIDSFHFLIYDNTISMILFSYPEILYFNLMITVRSKIALMPADRNCLYTVLVYIIDYKVTYRVNASNTKSTFSQGAPNHDLLSCWLRHWLQLLLYRHCQGRRNWNHWQWIQQEGQSVSSFWVSS